MAVILVFVSYRVADNPWKTRFNSNYAQKLLKDNGSSGDAIYTGNLILAQAALDNNDVTNAKQYLLQAAATPGAAGECHTAFSPGAKYGAHPC